jgi:alpha-aminoadipic semialdehyde synthase
MGIKEIPLPELPLPASVFQLTSSHPSLLPSTDGPSPHINPAATHLMFSHTHKGQEYNTPLLSRFVAPTSSSSVSELKVVL